MRSETLFPTVGHLGHSFWDFPLVCSATMVDFSKVPKQWDSIATLRKRAIKGRRLMVSTVKDVSQVLGNIKNVAENFEVLLPLVECMSKCGRVDSPSVDDITPLVVEFYSEAGFPDTANLEALAHQDSWGIKRCLTLLRRKWSRGESPKDCSSALKGVINWHFIYNIPCSVVCFARCRIHVLHSL